MKRALLVLLSLFPGALFATTYTSDGTDVGHNSSGGSIQWVHDNQCSDGDTITMPSGTVSWTTGISITKGISIIGNTTTNPVALTAVDNTVINDDVPRQPGTLMIINVPVGKSFRLSGVTVQKSLATIANNGSIEFGSTCQAARVDHCHFIDIQANYTLWITGWVYGVIDHNVFSYSHQAHSCEPMHVWMSAYGGGTYGEGSWEDGSNFGTNKFMFFEDNGIDNDSTGTSNINEVTGSFEALRGGRFVARYNHIYNGELQSHGTETIRDRGLRAVEVYNNDFHWPHVQRNAGQVRSGTGLFYNNTWDGTALGNGLTLQPYRPFAGIGPWGGANGNTGWDINATESDGTWVDGHSPYTFDSGTLTGATLSSTTQTMTDSTKSWTTNHWTDYNIVNLTNTAEGGTAWIQTNTGTVATCFYYTDSGGGTVYSNGDSYEIHKVLVALDQPGRGKSADVISGTTPLNVTQGNTVAWPHQNLEPWYSWSNVYTPGPTTINLQGGTGPNIVQANRDYYNQNTSFIPGTDNTLSTGVGVGTFAQRPAHCTAGTDLTGHTSNPPGVGYWATDTSTFYVCTATDTWTQYYQPYTYPHPLVSGSSSAFTGSGSVAFTGSGSVTFQ